MLPKSQVLGSVFALIISLNPPTNPVSGPVGIIPSKQRRKVMHKESDGHTWEVGDLHSYPF